NTKFTHSYSAFSNSFSSYFSQFSWLYNHLPHPLHFPMDSLTKCSSVLGALTLGTVLPEISTRLLLTRESIPSLMTMIFKEEMKSHHHSSRPLMNLGFLFLCFLSTMPFFVLFGRTCPHNSLLQDKGSPRFACFLRRGTY
ncbi:transmembrane protein, putative, partial [Medicago truncatula]